jgi:hypothetical protein
VAALLQNQTDTSQINRCRFFSQSLEFCCPRIRRIEAQDSKARREPLQEDLPAIGKRYSISVSKGLGGLFDKGHFFESPDLPLFPDPLRDFP